MKKYLLLVLFIFLPTLVSGQTTYDNKERLQPKIEFYADKYGVSSEVINHIIEKESGYDKDVVGDTYLTCRRTGVKMRARGLVQITDCYWPGVSDKQALDDDYAIEFLASWLSKGKCTWWSTCPIPKYLAKI